MTDKTSNDNKSVGDIPTNVVDEQTFDRFASRGIAEKKFNSGVVKFSKLYSIKRWYVKYLIAISLGLFMSIASLLLIKSTGLYTGGLSAAFQGVARLAYAAMMKDAMSDEHAKYVAQIVYNGLFWGLYLAANIPLTIFAYKKINKTFAKLTITYLIVVQGMGFVWGFIPGIENVHIFGDTSTVNTYLGQFRIQSIIFAPQWFPVNGVDWNNLIHSGDGGIYSGGLSVTWNQWLKDEIPNGSATGQQIVTDVTVENITRAFLLLVYAVVFSLISALAYTLMFILGGSTGGSDYVTIYLSQEKNKNVGMLFIIINGICMVIGIMMGTYGAGVLIDASKYSGWQYIFSANLFISLVWIILNGFLIDKWFPWHKMVRVEIYSDKITKINAKLKSVGYTHPATILNATGGYSGQPVQMLLTVCMTIELPHLVQCIRTVDDRCLISSNFIADIDGRMTMQRQTF